MLFLLGVNFKFSFIYLLGFDKGCRGSFFGFVLGDDVGGGIRFLLLEFILR